MLAPICFFTYNRLDQTKQTVEALKKNYLATNSDLFIFSDGYKNLESKSKVELVRNYIQTITGFNKIKIIESDRNKGLANSIVDGVTHVIKQYGKVIVLEDDLLTTPNFLNFMNQSLQYYEDDLSIQSVNGFSLYLKDLKFDNYFHTRPFPWGWGTWENRWDQKIFDKELISNDLSQNNSLLSLFKKVCGNDASRMLLDSLNGKNNSWYIRWVYNHFRNNTYSVYPFQSLVENIGFNPDGTHCKGVNSYRYRIDQNNKTEFNLIPFRTPSKKHIKYFLKYFSIIHKLKVRIHLLSSNQGRKQLLEDIKSRI